MDLALDLDPLDPGYRDLELDGTNDLLTADGKAAILQDILQQIGAYLGEWFLDNTIGVDYYGKILVKNPNPNEINAIFIAKILGVPGVVTLNPGYNFTPDFVTRTLAIKFNVSTTFGTVDYSGTANQ